MNKILLELRDLKDGVTTCSLTGDAEDLDLRREDYAFRSAVRIDLEISKSEHEISVEGRVSLPAEVECARCACSFVEEVKAEFSNRYIRVRGERDFDRESAEEGIFQIRYDEAELDLTDEVREAVLVSLPIRALCHTECKGLCPMCGANLNEKECSCSRPQGHPAWSVLKELKDRDNSK